MRFCCPTAVRNLTLFTLVVLSSHSFTSVNAQQNGSPTNSLSISGGSPAPSAPAASSQPSAPTPSSPSASPSPSPKPASHSPSPSSPPPPSSSSSSVSVTQPSAPLQSSSSSAQSSSSSTGTSSSSSSTSSSSLSSSVSSALSNTLSIPGPSAPVNPLGTYSQYSFTGGQGPTPSAPSSVPSETAVGANANEGVGFSHNKGAVTAVAVIASLVGVAIVGFIVFKVLKRRARLRDEEEDVYFEKYQENEPPMQTTGPSDSSYNIATATMPAATNAYPDRAMHYGDTQATGQQYADPQQYGMQYPPGTAYAAAAYGAPYQYGGDAGGYDASASGNHPFTHPQNNTRRTAAPRVALTYGAHQPSYETGESAYVQ